MTLYSAIKDENDCDNLQEDLSTIYKWANDNNMTFNSQKFEYLSYHTKVSQHINNAYLTPTYNIINPTPDVRDLGITMTNACTFQQHINKVIKACRNLVGWILWTLQEINSPC